MLEKSKLVFTTKRLSLIIDGAVRDRLTVHADGQAFAFPVYRFGPEGMDKDLAIRQPAMRVNNEITDCPRTRVHQEIVHATDRIACT